MLLNILIHQIRFEIVVVLRLHFYLCFWFLLIHATGFSCDTAPTISLLSVAGFSVLITVSCDEDAEEEGVGVVEELVDKPGTTNGT